MNTKLLITLTFALPFLLASETTSSENQPIKKIKIPIVDHEKERLKIEANCFANETSKSKAEWNEFVVKMDSIEIENAKRLIE